MLGGISTLASFILQNRKVHSLVIVKIGHSSHYMHTLFRSLKESSRFLNRQRSMTGATLILEKVLDKPNTEAKQSAHFSLYESSPLDR
jgi:hypothetical protein